MVIYEKALQDFVLHIEDWWIVSCPSNSSLITPSVDPIFASEAMLHDQKENCRIFLFYISGKMFSSAFHLKSDSPTLIPGNCTCSKKMQYVLSPCTVYTSIALYYISLISGLEIYRWSTYKDPNDNWRSSGWLGNYPAAYCIRLKLKLENNNYILISIITCLTKSPGNDHLFVARFKLFPLSKDGCWQPVVVSGLLPLPCLLACIACIACNCSSSCSRWWGRIRGWKWHSERSAILRNHLRCRGIRKSPSLQQLRAGMEEWRGWRYGSLFLRYRFFAATWKMLSGWTACALPHLIYMVRTHMESKPWVSWPSAHRPGLTRRPLTSQDTTRSETPTHYSQLMQRRWRDTIPLRLHRDP